MGQHRGVFKQQVVAAVARLLVAGGLVASGAAWGAIYSCVDASGNKRTSDRPIPECAGRDQRVLNPDGSTRHVLPPTPTADERAEQEARERQAAAERAQQQDAIRRDRNLVARFPNEAAHNKARTAALDDVKAALARSEKRLAELSTERKPLLDEAEFYQGREMPAKLKHAMEANETSIDAQRVLIQNQHAEIVRINALYDTELARLRRLWAGTPAGSMGALPAASGASAPVRKTSGK